MMFVVTVLLVCVGEHLLQAWADVLPAPSISQAGSPEAWIHGDPFIVRCSTPGGIIATGFQYFNGDRHIFQTQEVYNNTHTCIFNQKEALHGSYSCAYWIAQYRRIDSSKKSSQIRIHIPDFLEAPSISLIPRYPVYIRGESVNITCSAPSRYKPSGFRYFKKDEGKSHEEPSWDRGFQEISTSNLNTEGSYTCAYWIETSIKVISSRESGEVSISVRDFLEAPSISLIPSYPVYIRGESVNIRCSAPSRYKPRGFRYFKKDEGKSHEEPSWDRGFQEISTSNLNVEGSYTCAYWIETSIKFSSIESSAVSISVIDHPPAPSISLTPNYPVYVKGESVNITCSPPTGYVTKGFRHFKISGGNLTEIKSQSGDSHKISTSHPEAAGTYECSYWIETSGRQIQSFGSEAVSISVTDTPPAPSIALTPHYTVYIRGEPVTVTCIASAEHTPLQFQFIKKPGGQRMEVSSTGRASYKIFTSDPEAEGSYSCLYSKETLRRAIQSGESGTVSISVTDTPPAPSIALTPHYTVYIRGEPVTVTCIASAEHTPLQFQFFKKAGGQQMEVSSTGRASYKIFTSDPEAEGSYSCLYSKETLRRAIQSGESGTVSISVTDPLSPPVMYVDQAGSRVEENESVSLNCSAPSTYENLTFNFKGPEGLLGSQSPEPGEKSSQISFFAIRGNYSQNQTFSCYYEAVVAGRKLQSNSTDVALVTVFLEADSIPVHWDYIYYWTGGGAALFVLLILSLLICRMKKGTSHVVSSLSQEDYGHAKTVLPLHSPLLLEPKPEAEEQHLYAEIVGREPLPTVYATVDRPGSSPVLSAEGVPRSTISHSAMATLVSTYSTVEAPGPVPPCSYDWPPGHS
ncbi:immunoglobulin superfamily member 1-like [Lissotriton helveticus]